jgi:hypothetical protein
LRCDSVSESEEESGDEYQRDAEDHLADTLHNIQPVSQQAAPDPPYSSPVNHPGDDPGYPRVGPTSTACSNALENQNCFINLKRQSHEIFDLWFFRQTSSPRPLFSPFSVFANNFEFTEIFEYKVDSAVSMTPLSQNILLRQSHFSSF